MNRNKKTNTKKMIAKASAASLALALTATSVPATALPAFAATKTVSEFGAVSAKEATPKITLRNNATVYVSNKKFSIIKSNTKKLKFTIKSSNPKVAKVNSKGEVMAVKAGKATISVSYNVTVKGKKTKKTVKSVLTVKDPILFNKSAYNAVENDQALVKLISKKYDTKLQVVSATTTSKSVIKLNTRTGNFKALKAGTAKITLTLKVGNGYSKGGTVKYTRTIKVAAAQIEGVTLTKAPEKSTYKKDEALDLKGLVATVKYNNGTTKTISGEDVKVEKGIEQGKYGVQTIELSYAGFKFSFDVELEAPGVDPTPSTEPSVTPSVEPSAAPSDAAPSVTPSVEPSVAPSVEPSAAPSVTPSVEPSVAPSVEPSAAPSDAAPSADQPSVAPSTEPSAAPSDAAPSTDQPSVAPSTDQPSVAPSTPSEPQQATVTDVEVTLPQGVFPYSITEEEAKAALVVKAHYSDGTVTDQLDSKYYDVKLDKEGHKATVTVKYEGVEKSFDFEISKAAIVKLTADKSTVSIPHKAQTADQLDQVFADVVFTLEDEAGKTRTATWDELEVADGVIDPSTMTDNTVTVKVKDNTLVEGVKILIKKEAVKEGIQVGEVAPIDEGKDKDELIASIKKATEFTMSNGSTEDLSDADETMLDVKLPDGAADKDGKLVAGNWEVTVSLAGVKSTTVSVKVKDITAPKVVSGEVVDYKTLKVTFSEPVKATEAGLSVKVANLKETDYTAKLSEDKLSLILTSTAENGFSQGDYKVTVGGVQDEAANEISNDEAASTTTIKKAASTLSKVEFLTKSLPSAYDKDEKMESNYSGTIQLQGIDQFGGKIAISGTETNVTVSATVGTGSDTMPLVIGKQGASAGAIAANGIGKISEKLTISDDNIKALKTGKVVNISITLKDSKGNESTIGSASYELETYVAPTISHIKSIIVKKGGATVTDNKLTTGTTYTLSAEYLDQYGNDIADGSTPQKLTWASSDKNIGTISTTDNKPAATATLDLIAKGTVSVTAYLSDTEKKTVEFTVSAQALEGIVAQDGFRNMKSDGTYETVGKNLFSREELTSQNITAKPDGAELNPEDLKAVVTAKDSSGKDIDLTTEENKPTVTLVKAKKLDTSGKEKAEYEANTLQVKLTPAVKGTYTVKLFAANADVTKDSPLKVFSAIQVKNNPQVKEIKVLDSFKENEITAGGKSDYKQVEFINVNDEKIDVKAASGAGTGISFTKNGTVDAIEFYSVDSDGNPVSATGEAAVKYIKVVAKASAGAGSFTLQAQGDNGSAFKTVDVDVVAAGYLNTATFDATAAQANPIINDTFAEEATDTSLEVKVDGSKAYTLIPVTFKNQHGFVQNVKRNEINQTDGKITVSVKDNTANAKGYALEYFTKNTDGTITKAGSTDPVNYIGVHAATYETTKTPEAATLTLEAKVNGATEATQLAALTVTPRSAREISKVTQLKSDTTTTLANNPITFKVKVTDQYGKEIPKGYYEVKDPDGTDEIDITDNDKTGTNATNVEKTISIQPNANAESKDYSVQLNVNTLTSALSNPFAKAANDITETVTIKVKTVSDVKSVRFNNKVTNATEANDSTLKTASAAGATYDVSEGKKFYAANGTKVAIGIEALDADGNIIAVPITNTKDDTTNGIFENVSKVTVKHADGTINADVSGAVKINDSSSGKVELTITDSSSKLKNGDVFSFTLKSKKLGVECPVSVTVSTETPTLKTDIKAVDMNSTPDSDGKYTDVSEGVNGTYLDTKANPVAAKSMEIGVQGVDQYGILRTVSGSSVLTYTIVTTGSSDVIATNLNTSSNQNVCKLLPKKVGTGEIRINGLGANLRVPLNITQEDVNRFAPAVTGSASVVSTPLTYNKTAQNLITTTLTTSDGTVEYKVVGPDSAGTWNSATPTGTKAGTYTISYRVTGTNKADIPEKEIGSVTIVPATIGDADVSSTSVDIFKLASGEYYVVAGNVSKNSEDVAGTWAAKGTDNAIEAVFTPSDANYTGTAKKSTLSVVTSGKVAVKDSPNGITASSTTITGLTSAKKYIVKDLTETDTTKQYYSLSNASSGTATAATSKEAAISATTTGVASITAGLTAGHVYQVIEVEQ